MEYCKCKELKEKGKAGLKGQESACVWAMKKKARSSGGDEATLPEFSLPPRRTKAAPMRVMPV